LVPLSAARPERLEAWADGLPGRLLAPLGLLYAGAARLRVQLYRRGLLRSHRPPRPVLSIGNLAAGGTGKTPLLLDTVARLRRRGVLPGVLSRGHGGDENRLLEERHPEVPLAEGADRVRGMERLLAGARPPEILLLDDGFQHLRLQRDLDVVLLDALRPFGRCLPAGLFREPSSALRRADLVLLSRADLVDAERRAALRRRVEQLRGRGPWIEGGIRLREFRNLATGEVLEPAALHGREAFAAAGIGRPQSFTALLEGAGLHLTGTDFVADHGGWKDDALRAWERHERVVVTEKDAVKLRGRVGPNVWVARVDWVFLEGEETWEEALDRICLPVRAARIEPLWAAADPEARTLGEP